MEKKDGTIVIHLPQSLANKFSGLRRMKGYKSDSEYGCFIIESVLDDHQREFELMKSIFEADD